AATITASGSLGANPAVAEDRARSRKTTFVVIIGGLAIVLAALGFLLLRRSGLASPRAALAGSNDDDPHQPGTQAGGPRVAGNLPVTAVSPQGVVVSQGRSVAGRTVVCPSCRLEFPAGSIFCPHDGNRLAAAPLAPSQGPAPSTAGGVCPTCGRGYDPGVK